MGDKSPKNKEKKKKKAEKDKAVKQTDTLISSIKQVVKKRNCFKKLRFFSCLPGMGSNQAVKVRYGLGSGNHQLNSKGVHREVESEGS